MGHLSRLYEQCWHKQRCPQGTIAKSAALSMQMTQLPAREGSVGCGSGGCVASGVAGPAWMNPCSDSLELESKTLKSSSSSVGTSDSSGSTGTTWSPSESIGATSGESRTDSNVEARTCCTSASGGSLAASPSKSASKGGDSGQVSSASPGFSARSGSSQPQEKRASPHGDICVSNSGTKRGRLSSVCGAWRNGERLREMPRGPRTGLRATRALGDLEKLVSELLSRHLSSVILD
mmetsp:Transcript_59210/g.131960  ORF Transcript_59210/g.131960 Transcript_59210/m.131960 type:complete len:235 (-) Transcript_59210:627-1331(-)